jgi:hypothetical protein
MPKDIALVYKIAAIIQGYYYYVNNYVANMRYIRIKDHLVNSLNLMLN